MTAGALRATVNGVGYRLHVDADGRIEIAEDATEAMYTRMVDPIDTGRVRLIDASGRRTPADVATDGDVAWVFVNGDVFEIEVERSDQQPVRRRTGVGHEGLTAPMPATVVQVLVTPGALVTRGQTLVLLEAMKMELPVRAHRDGVVASVQCAAGDLVQPGVALVELTP
jgi:biotin carboxyl carrier protein